jgi:hypothetical protein
MSFWSTITGTTPQDEQQANLEKEQAQYNAALAKRQAAGTITQDQVAADQAYVNGITLEDTSAGAQQGFVEGLQQGWQNVLNAPGNAIGAVGSNVGQVVWGILKNIPWWVYLGALAAGFVYFGGFALLARRFLKR